MFFVDLLSWKTFISNSSQMLHKVHSTNLVFYVFGKSEIATIMSAQVHSKT